MHRMSPPLAHTGTWHTVTWHTIIWHYHLAHRNLAPISIDLHAWSSCTWMCATWHLLPTPWSPPSSAAHCSTLLGMPGPASWNRACPFQQEEPHLHRNDVPDHGLGWRQPLPQERAHGLFHAAPQHREARHLVGLTAVRDLAAHARGRETEWCKRGRSGQVRSGRTHVAAAKHRMNRGSPRQHQASPSPSAPHQPPVPGNTGWLEKLESKHCVNAVRKSHRGCCLQAPSPHLDELVVHKACALESRV